MPFAPTDCAKAWLMIAYGFAARGNAGPLGDKSASHGGIKRRGNKSFSDCWIAVICEDDNDLRRDFTQAADWQEKLNPQAILRYI